MLFVSNGVGSNYNSNSKKNYFRYSRCYERHITPRSYVNGALIKVPEIYLLHVLVQEALKDAFQ